MNKTDSSLPPPPPLKRALEWINNDLANRDPYDEKRTQTHDFDKCEYI